MLNECFWEFVDDCAQDRRTLRDPTSSAEERRKAQASIKLREDWFGEMFTSPGDLNAITLPLAGSPID